MDVKRITPFTNVEKNILTQLIQRFDVLKSKSMDGTTISQKNEAWHKISCLFNIHQETKVKRTPRQLKKLWNNMKHRKQIELKLKKQMEESEVKVEETPIVEFFDIGDGYRDQESILIPAKIDETSQQQRELFSIRLSIAKEELLKAKAETERAQAEARRALIEEELSVLKLRRFKDGQIS
ncbi:Myb/SANT-like DNA-binding domain [Popillia japonica]|uniref:Regulatory protein zeste n=1 Tax=Popillia japonica TaxID=7064 RepID=A0AAW1N2U8_POPJA